jgi:hypothetical protein
MGSLIIHPKAKEDIDTLGTVDPYAIGAILALFRQLQADPSKFAQLFQHDCGDFKTDTFNVKKWSTAQGTGRDLWRLKHLGLERDGRFYRLPYCASADHKKVHILGVFRVYGTEEDFDYDDLTHPHVRRVFDAYESVRGGS